MEKREQRVPPNYGDFGEQEEKNPLESNLIGQRMDHDDLVAGIIKRLSNADDPDDIILDICQKTGCSWSEAEGLVKLVQEKDEFQITEKQMPLLVPSPLIRPF